MRLKLKMKKPGVVAPTPGNQRWFRGGTRLKNAKCLPAGKRDYHGNSGIMPSEIAQILKKARTHRSLARAAAFKAWQSGISRQTLSDWVARCLGYDERTLRGIIDGALEPLASYQRNVNLGRCS